MIIFWNAEQYLDENQIKDLEKIMLERNLKNVDDHCAGIAINCNVVTKKYIEL